MNNLEYVGNELELFSEANNWKSYWAKHIEPFVKGRVLDVGAGLGSNLQFLLKDDMDWTCLEPDADLLKKVPEQGVLQGRRDPVKTVHGILDDIPDGETFDTIIYIDVLEHIEDDQGEIAKAQAYLNAGGHIIVLSPAYQWLYSPFDAAVGHFRRYTRPTLKRVKAPTLDLVRMTYLDSVGLLASLANKMMLRQSEPKKSQIAVWDKYMVSTSRVLDKLIFHSAGRSIIGVWRKSDG